jgi:hypothetical protein
VFQPSALVTRLNVELVARSTPFPDPAPPLPTPPPEAPHEIPPSPSNEAATEHPGVAPHFLGDPGLDELGEIPVLSHGQLTLSIHVSPLGTAEKIEVIRADPVPRELVDGLRSKLSRARYAPARSPSGKALAGVMEIVVQFEPAPASGGQ